MLPLFRMCLHYFFLSKTDVFYGGCFPLAFRLWYLMRFLHPLVFLDLAEKPECSVGIMFACVVSWQVSLGLYSGSFRWFGLGSTKTGYTSEGIQTICGASSKTAAKKSKGMSLSFSFAFHWKLWYTVTHSTVSFWIFCIFLTMKNGKELIWCGRFLLEKSQVSFRQKPHTGM